MHSQFGEYMGACPVHHVHQPKVGTTLNYVDFNDSSPIASLLTITHWFHLFNDSFIDLHNVYKLSSKWKPYNLPKFPLL